MDIRHPLQKLDSVMINWACENNLPVHILLTKADKFTRGKSHQVLHQVKKLLPSENISCQIFSSLDKEGLQEARAKISRWLLADKKQ
jgi:GTP-binding protein